jgi:hypothetical protein
LPCDRVADDHGIDGQGRVTSFKGCISALEGCITSFKRRIASLKGCVSTFKWGIASLEWCVTSFERRVSALEGAIYGGINVSVTSEGGTLERRS